VANLASRVKCTDSHTQPRLMSNRFFLFKIPPSNFHNLQTFSLTTTVLSIDDVAATDPPTGNDKIAETTKITKMKYTLKPDLKFSQTPHLYSLVGGVKVHRLQSRRKFYRVTLFPIHDPSQLQMWNTLEKTLQQNSTARKIIMQIFPSTKQHVRLAQHTQAKIRLLLHVK